MPLVLKVLLGGLGGVVGLAVIAAGIYVWNNLTAFDRDMDAVRRAGFVEKQAIINGTQLTYAEGPDNGPALLLIHGQMTDWKSYAPVLPELAKHYHVYAVDCHGHGSSARVPEKYSAVAMGKDFQQFIVQVIGEPAIVSGLSSGGLVTAWLGANAPEQVRGVVLEDPPLFSSVHPRLWTTAGYDLSRVAHGFLASGETDFTTYYLKNSSILELFKGLRPKMIADGVKYRAEHPGEPLKYYYMPPVLNELFRSLDDYDPMFGNAFYEGTWHEGFDHAATLQRIDMPARSGSVPLAGRSHGGRIARVRRAGRELKGGNDGWPILFHFRGARGTAPARARQARPPAFPNGFT